MSRDPSSIVEVGRADDVSLGGEVIERCRPSSSGSPPSALLFQRAQMFVFKIGGERGFVGDEPATSCVVVAPKLVHISGKEAHLTPVFVLSLI